MKLPKGRPTLVVKYNGKVRRLSKLKKTIRQDLATGKLRGRLGIKIGNKIKWQ